MRLLRSLSAAAAFCAAFAGAPAVAAVVSSSMSVTATVLPHCAGQVCSADAPFASTIVRATANDPANPAPTSALVQSVRVISY